MFITIDEFVSRHLRRLIRDSDALDAVFATYRSVGVLGRHPSGTEPAAHDGLTVHVWNGAQDHFNALRRSAAIMSGILRGGPEAKARSARLRTEEDVEIAREQQAIDAMLDAVPDDGRGDTLAVLYAGRPPRFERAVLSALRFARRRGAGIVLVTCACDSEEKHRLLDPLLAGKKIAKVVETRNCGAVDEMERILTALTEFWPCRRPM